ncbi:MAG TPA: hypothetical protein P5120_07055 [Spirochaetota bacterium]|nr:hypothetical protein [Spirochaetota bacterium]HPF05140.1 hypothetical protein [Spirochaetota bacterium]HPJ42562.1 hypothetical protein [Spirochaetota bacterium]HPR36275.1 hypothetical protein [Spirochaetota bacterium]HRX47260.1 hypothetical protein [Spirochaetota bacterium]
MSTPYIYFKFLGIHSFISTLENSATEYTLFEDDFSELFTRHENILKDEDSITTGILTREGQQVFFAELGIKITKSFRSYFVFIFDHHPTIDDMDAVVLGLEDLISENLDNIDPSEIAKSMQNPSGGHTIN